MSNRYLVWQLHRGRWTPRCDLTGSPFTSNKQAKSAAKHQGLADFSISPIRRRSACH